MRRHPAPLLLASIGLVCQAACTPAAPPATPPRSIVLISLDTLRPDRLGIYGNAPDVSPRIDGLATRGVVFEDALAPTPWTLPSHMSLLTGLDPVAHGVRTEADVLPDAVLTLAERLKSAGYATAAFTDGGFLAGRYGFRQGFDEYADERAKRGPNGFRRLLPEALTWMEARGESPYFVFLHTFDPHARYSDTDPQVLARFRERPVPESPRDHWLATTRYLHLMRKMGVNAYGRLSQLTNDYDAGVHVADRGVGEVLDLLERGGRLEDAVVVVTSDHGESFLDRGPFVGHGLGLTDDEIAVPLILKLPRDEAAGIRMDTPVDLLDVVPTLLDVAGLTEDAVLEGQSLRALLRGAPRRRNASFGESTNTGAFFLVEDDYKYLTATRLDALEIAQTHLGPMTPPVLSAETPGTAYAMGGVGRGVELRYDAEGDPLGLMNGWTVTAQLYRRSGDPEEGRDLHDAEPERVRAMRASLASRIASSAARRVADSGPEIGEPRPGERAELEALGYLAPGGASGASLELPLDRPRTEGPDMRAPLEQDRIVHAIHMRSLEGRPTGAEARAALERAAEVYAAWADAHPEHVQRATWRLRELARITARVTAAEPAGPAPGSAHRRGGDPR